MTNLMKLTKIETAKIIRMIITISELRRCKVPMQRLEILVGCHEEQINKSPMLPFSYLTALPASIS